MQVRHAGAPASLYCPGTHATCVADGEPGPQEYPAVQLLQTLAPPAPLYVPAGQAMELLDPAGQYVPALQIAVHDEAVSPTEEP